MSKCTVTTFETSAQVAKPSPVNPQVMRLIEKCDLSFSLGNVVNSICVYGNNGSIEDLEQARWFLDRAIENARDLEAEAFPPQDEPAAVMVSKPLPPLELKPAAGAPAVPAKRRDPLADKSPEEVAAIREKQRLGVIASKQRRKEKQAQPAAEPVSQPVAPVAQKPEVKQPVAKTDPLVAKIAAEHPDSPIAPEEVARLQNYFKGGRL